MIERFRPDSLDLSQPDNSRAVPGAGVVIVCPACDAEYRVDRAVADDADGRQVWCANCGAEWRYRRDRTAGEAAANFDKPIEAAAAEPVPAAPAEPEARLGFPGPPVLAAAPAAKPAATRGRRRVGMLALGLVLAATTALAITLLAPQRVFASWPSTAPIYHWIRAVTRPMRQLLSPRPSQTSAQSAAIALPVPAAKVPAHGSEPGPVPPAKRQKEVGKSADAELSDIATGPNAPANQGGGNDDPVNVAPRDPGPAPAALRASTLPPVVGGAVTVAPTQAQPHGRAADSAAPMRTITRPVRRQRHSGYRGDLYNARRPRRVGPHGDSGWRAHWYPYPTWRP